MENRASITALMSAFARAYHNENCPQPVFADPVVRKLITEEEYRQISSYIVGGIEFFAPGRKSQFASEGEILDWVVGTQLAPTPLGRARFCEDSLKTAVQTGTSQYVILGAGLDTFAWRSPELMARLSVFEVDHPLTQADKRERLDRAELAVPENLHFVPVDFRSDDLRQKLHQSGFDEKQKTFFSWLGVSYYLSEEEIGRLLECIASFAAEGSTLLFDYADEGLFSAQEKRVKNMLAMAAAGGEPMKFCSEEWDLTMLLEQHHFLVYEHLNPPDIAAAYFADRTDGLTAFEHISYVLAVLKDTVHIHTKEKILQTALRLFARRGCEAVSVKDIADRLCITKGALYRHYTSKQNIVDCIVERMETMTLQQRRDLFGTCTEAGAAAHGGGEAGGTKDAEGEGNHSPITETGAGDSPAVDRYRAAVDRINAPGHCSLQSVEEDYLTATDGICRFCTALFSFWAAEEFPSSFRKMLTLEQYRTSEMAALYRHYLISTPLTDLEKLFLRLNGNKAAAGQRAAELYAVIFLFYSLYDEADDKIAVIEQLQAHIDRLTARL